MGHNFSWPSMEMAIQNKGGLHKMTEQERRLVAKIKSIYRTEFQPFNFQYVYIIQGDGKFKVGKSRTPLTRLREIQVGNPDELSLVAAFAHAGRADSSELRAHKMVGNVTKKIRGEWFLGNGGEFASVVRNACKRSPAYRRLKDAVRVSVDLWDAYLLIQSDENGRTWCRKKKTQVCELVKVLGIDYDM